MPLTFIYSISIFPIPFKHEIQLYLPLEKARNVTIQVSDLLGLQIIQWVDTLDESLSLKTNRLQHISPGIYLMRVTGKNQFYEKKLVKE